MKYFLLILSTIALISVISVSLLFGYKTFIDMNNIKQDSQAHKTTKIREQANDKDKKELPVEGNENGDNPNSENNTIAQPNTNNTVTTNNVRTNNVRTNECGEVIHKTKNGIDCVEKFDSPQEEAQYERNVMSQTSGGPTPQNDKSDYEKQLEMYEKAARGEVEEPGAHVH